MSFVRKAWWAGLLLLLAGCQGGQEPIVVDVSDTLGKESLNGAEAAPDPIRIAIGAIASPQKSLEDHEAILWYVGDRLGRPVEIVLRKTYAEVNSLLEHREVDMAFVCSGPYVDGKKRFGLELLAVPQMGGKRTYRSYIIVPNGSPVRSFEDLEDKRFAFTDPLSTTGKLFPTFLLVERETTPGKFFGKTIFTRGHDNSVRAVGEGVVDAAAVDHLVWEALRRTGDPASLKTRALLKSPEFGMPPMVVHPSLDPALKARLRRILLEMHGDSAGARLLRSVGVEKFVPQPDSAYDEVRRMRAAVNKAFVKR